MAHTVLSLTLGLLAALTSLAKGANTVLQASQGPGASPAVRLGWGIADTTASVGQRFTYHIPGDAFSGKVAHLQVVEVGRETLPSWLELRSENQLLLGVPGPRDVGHVYLEASAHGQDGSLARDTFTITVSPESPSAQPRKLQSSGTGTVWCGQGESETLATVVVDASWEQLTGARRVALLENATEHLRLPRDALRLLPRGDRPLIDSSVLVSGKGESREAHYPGCMAMWRVGCGRVEGEHMVVLQRLETDAASGALARALGHPVLTWHVTNTHFQHRQRRLRRQAVRTTATPAVTPTPPVRPPTQQTTVMPGASDVETMTRAVPSMASPSFDIHPTQTLPPLTRTDSPEATPVPGLPDRPDGILPSASTPEGTGPGRTEILPTKTMMVTTEPPTKKGPTRPTRPTMEPSQTTPGTPVCLPNTPPEVDVPLPVLQFTAGEVVRYKIPENLFRECSGAGTRQLNLHAFKDTTVPLGQGFWMQFDSKRQMFHGLPLAADVGSYRINLVATKPKTDIVKTHLVQVEVLEDRNAKVGLINHEMSLRLDKNFEDFVADTSNAVSLANKISRLYGERHGKSLTITSLQPGSVRFAWTNNSLASPGCPVEEIKQMFDKLIKEDGTLTEEAMNALSQFKVMSASGEARGACVNNANFPLRPAPGTGKEPDMPGGATGKPVASTDLPASSTEDVAKGSKGEGSDGDLWITTVVPAVVIIVILLIALLIACILYRKKRKGKMNLEDQNTFVRKGVPVIFADELDEKPGDSSKPLLLEGSPPAPPPGYQRGSSESPKINHQHYNGIEDAHEMENIEETDVTSPLYAPPPPVTASSGNKQRPHVQPSYRTQPPSIPP